MWSHMPGDFVDGASPRRVADIVAKSARAGDLVVLHDSRSTTADTIAEVIDRLRERPDPAPRFGVLD